MGRLADRRILVMGGTGGIGLAAAQAFVRDGARVCVVGRDDAKLAAALKALGERATGLAGDAADPATAEAAVARCVESFGGVDGLYHVAGGSGRRFGDGPLHEITDEGWARTLELNVTSVMRSNRAVLRRLREQGTGGSIVNCGSVLASSPSSRHFCTHAYAAAKAAIVGLTRSAAARYAGENIRFNVLSPALVATPMSGRAQEDAEIMEFVRTKQPLDGGRIGVPADLEGAVVFLLGEESRFVTGQELVVDGGWSVSDGGGSSSG